MLKKGKHPDSDLTYQVDTNIDVLWAREAEARIDAYERGEIRATPADEIFKDINLQTDTF
jgi:hypothetical protein